MAYASIIAAIITAAASLTTADQSARNQSRAAGRAAANQGSGSVGGLDFSPSAAGFNVGAPPGHADPAQGLSGIRLQQALGQGPASGGALPQAPTAVPAGGQTVAPAPGVMLQQAQGAGGLSPQAQAVLEMYRRAQQQGQGGLA